jgi:hypothetical protein
MIERKITRVFIMIFAFYLTRCQRRRRRHNNLYLLCLWSAMSIQHKFQSSTFFPLVLHFSYLQSDTLSIIIISIGKFRKKIDWITLTALTILNSEKLNFYAWMMWPVIGCGLWDWFGRALCCYADALLATFSSEYGCAAARREPAVGQNFGARHAGGSWRGRV